MGGTHGVPQNFHRRPSAEYGFTRKDTCVQTSRDPSHKPGLWERTSLRRKKKKKEQKKVDPKEWRIEVTERKTSVQEGNQKGPGKVDAWEFDNGQGTKSQGKPTQIVKAERELLVTVRDKQRPRDEGRMEDGRMYGSVDIIHRNVMRNMANIYKVNHLKLNPYIMCQRAL